MLWKKNFGGISDVRDLWIFASDPRKFFLENVFIVDVFVLTKV